MKAVNFVDLIGLGLGKIRDKRIVDLSYIPNDRDGDLSSLVVVTKDANDGRQEWIIVCGEELEIQDQ
jgi:hypothetical protein